MSPHVQIAAQEWFTAAELAAENLPMVPTTKRGVALLAKRDNWDSATARDGTALARPRKGRGGGTEYHFTLLPDPAKAKLLVVAPAKVVATKSKETRESAWRRYEALPSSLKVEAASRLKVLQRVEELTRAGLQKTIAVREVVGGAAREARRGGEEAPYSESTVYSWFRAVAGVGDADRLAYLAPAYLGRNAEAECSPEAWRLYRELYLRLSRPTFAVCYRQVVNHNEANGLGWTIPSAKTMARWIGARVPRVLQILMREGEDALRREQPWIERDETVFHAVEAVNADGHKWDVMVDWGDGGKPERPMMVAIQDVYSRKMLAWRVVRSESANAVRMAFADVFKAYGIPRHIFFDNGRAFASKWLTGGTPTRYRFQVREEDPVGLLTEFGCQVHFTTPFHGQAKPIERAFRDLEGSIGTLPAFQGAYVGNNPLNKPADAGTRAIPIGEFEAIVSAGIAEHNRRPNRKTKACAGRLSFDDAFKASYADALVQVAGDEQLRKALLCVEGVTVRQNGGGIELAKNRYWGDFLVEHVGERVAARFDPDNLHGSIHVYTLTGVWLGEAKCLDPVGFISVEQGREHLKMAKRISKAAKALRDLEQLRDARQLADLTNPTEPEDDDEPLWRASTVVAGVFGNTARKIEADDAELSDAEIDALHARTIRHLRPVGDE